jgi:hypothetical protein
MVHANAETRGHGDGEIQKEQTRRLSLDRQGPDETFDEVMPYGQCGQQMDRQDAEELPDRKRLDEGSDLTAVEGQHDEHEGVVNDDSSHESLRLVRHGWTIGLRVE